MYLNEEGVGQGIKNSGIPREEIFVTTKLACTFHSRAEECLDQSLSKMGLDYVDLYLMHWPLSLNPNGNHFFFPKKPDGTYDTEEGWDFTKTWRSLEGLLNTGKVKAIGVSNFSTVNLEKLLKTAEIIPAVNQCELHPYLSQEKLLKYCNEKGIHLTSYSPFGSTNTPLLREPVITEIANKNGMTEAQVILAWCIQRGTSVIPKSVTPSRITSNFQVSELPEDDFLTLNKLGETHKVRYISLSSSITIFHDDE
ncbi:hypothetical protein MERGE_000910 [Pneumocystis wakefieldiae]|uniref:NADP-dependent oxidoreductase domain-containing protein n=1 Tax=Pneumocystis wakefieldiae TaxID=38082 RepID=A0A899FRI9_9ASCO|nr:hypothetical protein MERGE_000910 [Pneumocystis wakefieldiae]